MPFHNRADAAEKLAEKLSMYKGENPLVLAIPRGAVPMGKMIAERLDGELDVILVRKLGAPGNPEFAIGAVDEAEKVAMGEGGFSEDDPFVRQEIESQMRTLRERRKHYTPERDPVDPAGRVVIIVDDGVATGSTMLAALRSVRDKNPAKLIAAIGVAPPDTMRVLEQEADEVVCLEIPAMFLAVGQFFEEFEQVSDEEVIALLK